MVTGRVARTVAPSRNWTVPVAAAGDTEAVRFTVCPYAIDPLSAASVVVVGAFVIVSFITAEAAEVQLASPRYVADIAWLPTVSAVVLSDAVPPLTVAVPITVAPSRNCTLPVAVAGDTVAVTVTGVPKTDGFADEINATAELALLTVCINAAEVDAV